MNFTGGGTVRNIESVYSFEDRPGIAEREFERFWDAADAKPFSDFDLKSYESERSRLLTAVKEVGATDVLEQEIVDIAGDPVQVDALLEGWKDYVSELKKASSGERRANWRDVLNNRHRLVNRDWSQNLSDDELNLMFGTGIYKAFGNLKQAKVNQNFLRGPENLARKVIGEALMKATILSPIPLKEEVVKVVEKLHGIKGFGGALTTRLLVLARPDLFVVFNKKSFEKLQKRFDVPVSNAEFEPRTYVNLLVKIWEKEWFQSSEPEDLSERDFWHARTALLDLVVYTDI